MTQRCPLPIPDHPPIPRLPAFSRWLVDLHSPNLCSVIRKEALFRERDLIPPVPEAEARNSLRSLLRDWTEISCTDLVSSDRLIAPSEASAFALAPKARPPARAPLAITIRGGIVLSGGQCDGLARWRDRLGAKLERGLTTRLRFPSGNNRPALPRPILIYKTCPTSRYQFVSAHARARGFA